ncbi:activated CDC42 kinase 1-like [Sinocyclocheilus grahami]|uniref:activated CDC42 kinase 1-like n=1 Tax=Sinocyclocheilus grahami TaxID=75366 RepID=UPI0007AD10A8|nr:PREDICTED: activated CDC42 kinase 1-like [Sinocyclocheilus grahami]
MMDRDTQWLYQLLASVQLERFYVRMRDGLNVTRIEHLNYVKEADLEQIGISRPGQRRLWEAVRHYKINMRPRSWMVKAFSGRTPEGSEQFNGVGSGQGPEPGRALPCLIQDSELIFGDRLGSGSFGVVRKAEWQTPTGRVLPVAVKTLRGGGPRYGDVVTEFLQEVSTMQSLHHPNIIHLYGVVLTHPLKMAQPMELRAVKDFTELRKLSLQANDLVTVIDHGLEMCEWKGQNQRTLSVGWFPPALAAPALTVAVPAPGPALISSPVKGSLQHTGHGDTDQARSWGNPERINDSRRWRIPLSREKEGSNLTKMAGISRSLESVLGGSQDKGRGPGGNAAQRADPRRLMQCNLMQDPRRFSDAIVIPPARPPPPSFKCISPPNTVFKCVKPQMMTQDRRPVNPAGWAPQTHSQLQFQFQPQQQCLGNSNLDRMAHLAKSSPQLDDGPEKEKERDKEQEKEREREKAKERYPPQVDKEAVIAQVQEAVHGVTLEQVQKALYRSDWNPVWAEQQLKTDQLYYMTQSSREECQKILARYKWDLQLAGRYIIRQDRDRDRDRTALDRRGERV